ncbi:hypothetical protein [Flavobacterium hiemivividum]|uniref:tRNA (Guanine-N1)-methyltransferase n=1 Tax=Flavobacterium hiemivividum TaxID=2541734 RepID=A0A4R5D673_9FLAO|nr:hypothetical protein [Flavobacterium hiemivividum]TDE05623.1 hypothetical protein E0F98_05745 [Flavobacterium hiemivividum]
MKHITITAIALLLFTTNIFSQTPNKIVNLATVEGQFQNIIDKSNSFQDYKVIKKTSLLKLQSNVLDSLKVSKNKVLANVNFLNSQKRAIADLEAKSANSETILANLKSEKDSISLLGIPLEKTFFKTLFFFIVIGLIATLVFFIFKFKQSNIITIESKLALQQSEKEFEIYKEKALEREQKAMRRLQDELNKKKKEFATALPK